MARIRSIHPGLASDENFMSMSMAAKAAWSILWTECDDHGIFEWKPIVLKARIFPADNVDFAAILAEYIELGCVDCREVDGKRYGFIRNFCRYQRPKHPSYRYTLPPDMELFIGLSVKSTESQGEASPRPTENHPQMKEEGGKVKEEKKEEDSALRAGECAQPVENVRRETWPSEYQNQFWQRYPRKVGKLAALKALERARKAGVKFEIILAGIERIPKQDLQFVPHPATWLNRGGWDDEEIPGGSSGQRGPRAFQDDRLSLTKAADRLIDRAERGEFTFGPRPRLLPESSENDLRLLPERRSA